MDIVFHTGSIYYTVDGHEVNTTAQVSNVSVTVNGKEYKMDANTSIDGNSGYEEYAHGRNNNITITQTSPIRVSCNLTLNLTPGSAAFNELKAILDKSGASYSVNSAGKLVVPYTVTFTYAQHFYLNMCKSSGFDIQIAGGIFGKFYHKWFSGSEKRDYLRQ